MTDTEDDIREFARVQPTLGSAEMGRFIGAMRRLQDIAVSTNPDAALWDHTAELLENVCAQLEQRKAPAAVAPAGRAPNLPGNGHPLMPPWQVAESGPDEVTMRGHFSRFHVGGNDAVHGGVIPLFYDWHFGMVVSAAGRPDSRTAYLHVDYRRVTPIDVPLESRAWIDSVDGRKLFVRAVMTDLDGNVLSEANGLMIKLLPHQP
ncbi:thioesterase [Mycolicibacterium celeriflavum]|uniref:Acyl-coenzyme A thioesterase THEM4 n=1 Tax=Mycolicibacterium celeriflavum TaxID=1249101 RepID=A0A1X0BVG1_MYCCF|nr:PaaI family thioesterase [Mycolicibacterium celeriflavum]MCV7240615.1 PaaI family thioesterase [Mycolicibacterium celeriflavum]OBG24346.1 thioesterase [Mycolicibacterium celeriflavum]ORA48096.1 thioesterase [Mycolicibacterium celeriflavum]BBY43462.1 thioesterase [Mycolicibacterium celeriflavum]